MLKPGDHVLIESPTYDPLFSIPMDMNGISTDFVHRSPQDYQLGIEAINKKLKRNTRLIVLTNLHAPTSVRLNNLDEILYAIQVRNRKRKRKTYVMVDEVYMDLADDITPPAATLNECGISTNGLSKCYGLEGLRHGVILAVPEVISDVKAFNTKCFPSNSASLETIIKEFYSFHRVRILKDIKRSQQKRFEIVNEYLTNAGIKFQRPNGGCTVLIQLALQDDTTFSNALLGQTRVAVTPGHLFNAPGTIRLGYMQGANQHMEDGLKMFCEFYKYWSEEQD